MFGSSNIYWYILKLYILIFNKRCLLLFFSRWEMLVRVVKGKVMGESWSQWTNSVNVEDHAPIPGIAERVPVIAERVPEKAEAKVMVVNEEDRDHPKDHIDLMSNLVDLLCYITIVVCWLHSLQATLRYLYELWICWINFPHTQNGAFRLLGMLTWYERKNPSIENWLEARVNIIWKSRPVWHAHALFNFKIPMYYA